MQTARLLKFATKISILGVVLSFLGSTTLAEPKKETASAAVSTAGTPGITFLATYPDVGYIIIGLLFGLIVLLIKDRGRLTDQAYNKALTSLAADQAEFSQDQDKFFANVNLAITKLDDRMSSLDAKFERTMSTLDSKFERTMTTAFNRIDTLTTELSFLKGEHKARKAVCHIPKSSEEDA